MGVKIKKTHVVVDSNGYHIRPGRLDITKKKILKYVENNPMPEDPAYSLNNLVVDLTGLYEEIYMLPINIKETTMRYVETLINELRNDRRQHGHNFLYNNHIYDNNCDCGTLRSICDR